MEVKNEGDEPMAHGGRHRGKHARGGHAKEKVNLYNAQGSPEAKEAEDEKDEFSKGGRKKRTAGGVAPGVAAAPRGDKGMRGRAAGGKAQALKRGGKAEEEEEKEEEREHHARGGRAGNSPWSSGKQLTAPERAKSGNNEGVKVPEAD